MKRLLGLFIAVFAVLLMSHNAGAVSRLGNFINYSSGGISGLPSSWQYNRDTNVSATGNSSSYIANGQFGWNLNWEDGKEYYVSIAVMMSAYSSNASTIGSLNAEPINLQGDNYYTINDTITSQRSCSNANNCRSVLVHSIKLLGTGNASEAVKLNQSNLFNISDFWAQYNGSATLSWNAYIFEDYNEWEDFQNDVINELQGIHSDTSDIVDTLGEINDKLDALDNNADANAQAWENMQDTDGLVDIGNDSQALSIVGSLNSVLGQVRDIPAAVGCTINANFPGRINLGDLNFCTGKETLGNVVAFSATVIFLFISFFIVLRVIKKVIRLISWCRKN